MAGEKPELFRQAVSVLGMEFFEKIVFDYAGGPLFSAVYPGMAEDGDEYVPFDDNDTTAPPARDESDDIPF